MSLKSKYISFIENEFMHARMHLLNVQTGPLLDCQLGGHSCIRVLPDKFKIRQFEKKSVGQMDLSPIRQNFEKNRNRQKYHHSLKEHPMFSKIAKFGCEML